jgi:putative nucleotidyltransferase with HDIG domain
VINTATIAPASGESSVRKAPSSPTATRVLAVDDELPALRILCLMFGAPAFLCTAASSGEEALAALQRERFDAVVSDLHMPGIGGMQLLAETRRRFPEVAFLVTTGVDDVEVGVQAMRLGADDYLVKPLLESAVLANLGRALHRRKLEQEVENYRRHLEEMVAERTGQLNTALQQIQRSYEDTLRALGAAVDLRDHETAGHSQRVCHYALEIAKGIGLAETQLKNLARGAYLHDIGKLGVPDGILLKPGPLTADEWKVMQQHVQIGFELIKDIPFLADTAELILCHHERYDGSGYPRGLRAEQIPVDARIFALADTLDAITSDRPYRLASSFETARETIRCQSGRQFDPEFASVFLRIPTEIWSTIARKLLAARPSWQRHGLRF